MTPRFSLLKAVAAIALLGASTSVHAADGAAELKSLYEQAKKSGESQVVLYTPYGNLQPVWDEFTKAYPGIVVQPAVISGGGAPLLARTRAEAASGNHVGDIVLSGLGDINTLIHENRVEKNEPAQSATLAAQYKGVDGLYQIPFNTLFTIVYNPNLIKEADLPKTLDEAIGPKWAGKYGIAKYTGAAAPDLVGTVLSYNNAITDNQLRQIKQNAQIVPTAITVLTNVAQGRLVFGLWGPTQNVRQLQSDGAPIKVHLLADSAVIQGPGISLIKNAPHPAAAKLLKGWLLSDGGQKALGEKASSYGTQPNAPVPPGLPDLKAYTFKTVPLANFEDTLKAFRARTLAIWGQ
jgi:iron(III) transport system substrate-binding protein